MANKMKTGDGKNFEFFKPIWQLEELNGDLQLKYLADGLSSDFWEIIPFNNSVGFALKNFAGGILVSDEIFADEAEGLHRLKSKLQGVVDRTLNQIGDTQARIQEIGK